MQRDPSRHPELTPAPRTLLWWEPKQQPWSHEVHCTSLRPPAAHKAVWLSAWAPSGFHPILGTHTEISTTNTHSATEHDHGYAMYHAGSPCFACVFSNKISRARRGFRLQEGLPIIMSMGCLQGRKVSGTDLIFRSLAKSQNVEKWPR